MSEDYIKLTDAPKPVQTLIDGVPVTIIPPEWQVEKHHELMEVPRRIQTTQDFEDLESFIDYVDGFSQPSTALFLRASQDKIEIESILDYHIKKSGNDGSVRPKPGWGEHRARFLSTMTPAWRAWKDFNNNMVSQSDFADFIYQNRDEIVEPSGAELLEIISTLTTTAKGEFTDQKDDFTGSTELIFRLKVSATGGTNDRVLKLPKQFRIGLTMCYGCPHVALTADLRLRIPKHDGDPVLMGFRFYRLDDAVEHLAKDIADQVEKKLKFKVWRAR